MSLVRFAADLQGCSGPNCLDTPGSLKIVSGVSLGSGSTAIINTLTLIAVVIATILLLIGGIRMITGGNNPQNVASARNTITYAIIGLIIAILARAIIGFVLQNSP